MGFAKVAKTSISASGSMSVSVDDTTIDLAARRSPASERRAKLHAVSTTSAAAPAIAPSWALPTEIIEPLVDCDEESFYDEDCVDLNSFGMIGDSLLRPA